MARPQVADGGDGLQILRVAANILNKQSRTADKGLSSSLGVGRGANNSSPQKISLLRKITISQVSNSLKNPQPVQNYWVFEHRPSSGILKNTTLRKLDLFPFLSVGETPTLLGPLEKANPSHWIEVGSF
jgi:hypothetical protein